MGSNGVPRGLRAWDPSDDELEEDEDGDGLVQPRRIWTRMDSSKPERPQVLQIAMEMDCTTGWSIGFEQPKEPRTPTEMGSTMDAN